MTDKPKSGTSYADLFAALGAPFDPSEVKTRSQAGRQFHYVTSRTVMNRLDEVFGPENWWDAYEPGAHSVVCKLTVRLPDGTTLTKADAGGYSGLQDEGDNEKGGFADAFKRAAVKFGVGRYLYNDGVPQFVADRHPTPTPPPQPTQPSRNGKGGGYSYSNSPSPAPRSQARAQDGRAGGSGGNSGGGSNQPQITQPRTGRQLFVWSKQAEEQHEVGMTKYLQQWGSHQGYPDKMVDWDADQVQLAYQEAQRKLDARQA